MKFNHSSNVGSSLVSPYFIRAFMHCTGFGKGQGRGCEFISQFNAVTTPQMSDQGLRPLCIQPGEKEFFEFLYGEATGRLRSPIKVAEIIYRKESFELFYDDEVTTAQKMLATITSELSLNKSELARVLLVRRPSIYSWMRGGELRTQNNKRLSAIYEIALQWRRHSNLPLGDSVRQLSGKDGSLLELLSRPNLPRDQILDRFKQIAERMNSQAPRERNVPLSVKELRQLHDISPKGRVENVIELDAGKRGNLE